jgi:DNA-binding beta-propeller fold protein YncE
VAVDEANNTIYAASANDGNVSVIDGRTCEASNLLCAAIPVRVTVRRRG